MTQSGQGPDPQNSAAGPAREGIVLPANGEQWVPDQQAAPPAGQPWGQPWGPGQQAAPAPEPYGQQPAQEQSWGQQQSYGQPPAQAPAPLPSSAAGQGFPAPPPQMQSPVPPSMPQQTPPQQGAAGGALPPEGPTFGGQPFAAPGQQPPVQSYGQQGGQPPMQPYGQQGEQPQSGQSGELVRATPQTGAPLPPAAGDAEATALIPPFNASSGGPGAAPLPPETAGRPETLDESTTMLRAVKPGQGRPQGHAQPMPQGQPMPGAAGDAEATQLIPPVGAGGATPPPGVPYGVRPGAPSDRPTPAEFDGLFRDGPGAPPVGAPDATAQLPRFEDPGQPPYGGQGQGLHGGPGQGPYGGPGQGYGQQFPPGGGYDQQPSYEDNGSRWRRIPPAAIIGIIVVALAGAGLGLGWALSGGSDDTGTKQGSGSTAKTAKEPDAPKQPSSDPAEAQAKGLDALLGDSNNSRSSVIGAVNNIKKCDNLDGAAKDLRAAAGQRNDLVKRLQQLPVDKIPNSGQLTAALTKAWQSSAAADNHYAAWADQAGGGKKGCHKGKARGTQQAAQGNAASGQATQAKKQAAQLWNPLAQKYGLTERRPDQL